MNMSFSFNKVKRSFFTVELKAPEGENGKRLIVKMPKKKTFEKINAIGNIEDMTMDDAFDTLGGIVSEILSNNMAGERVSSEYVTENYDIEEMSEFIDNFMNFVNGKAKTDPN